MLSFKEWYEHNYQDKEIEKVLTDFLSFEIDHDDLILSLNRLGYVLNNDYDLTTTISLRPASYSGKEYVLFNQEDQVYFFLFDGVFKTSDEWKLEMDELIDAEIKGHTTVSSELLSKYKKYSYDVN